MGDRLRLAVGLAVGLSVGDRLVLAIGLAVGDRLGQVVTSHQGPVGPVGSSWLAHPEPKNISVAWLA